MVTVESASFDGNVSVYVLILNVEAGLAICGVAICGLSICGLAILRPCFSLF